MSSKKGSGPAAAAAAGTATTPSAASAAAAATNRASSPSQPAAASRGSMTSNGSTAALQFLSARWRAVDAAANDASLKADEKPEIHKEKGSSSQATPTASHQQQTKGSGHQSKGGGAWGRREPFRIVGNSLMH